jgi:hypothetical protein
LYIGIWTAFYGFDEFLPISRKAINIEVQILNHSVTEITYLMHLVRFMGYG